MADQQMQKRESHGELVRRVGELFKANKARILAGVPKLGGDPTRLLSIAYNSIIYDEKLVACTHKSLLGGVMEALKMGITIGGPMQESFLVPFNNRVKRGNEWGNELQATLIVGFQGYRNIIDRGRAVLDLHPRAVHVEDEFDYWFGDDPRIIHRPKRGAPLKESELRAVYAVARLRGGGKQLEVLEKAEVDQHRARSRAKDSGPWANEHDYVAMAMKTSLRKISKYLPKSSEILSRALQLDEQADTGATQEFEIPEGAEFFDAPAGELQAPTTDDRLNNLSDQLKQRGAREAIPVDRRERQPGEEG